MLPVGDGVLDEFLIVGEELEMQEGAEHRSEVALIGQRLMDAGAEATVLVPEDQRIFDQFQIGFELAVARAALTVMARASVASK